MIFTKIYRIKLTILKYLLSLIIIINILNQAKAACNDEDTWDCDNGDCIAADELCDGKVDCRDGSDEIAENCIQTRCQSFAFRCAYGACITGKFKCDGKQNCADNSDEISCEENWLQLQQGNCGEGYMKCRSGECIATTEKCDGRRDCRDGSDETVEFCSSMQCPTFAFHCGYGGCVDGKARCNGTTECHDGSDEAWKLCDYPRKRSDRPIVPSTTSTTRRTPIENPFLVRAGCRLDLDTRNLIIKDMRGNRLQQGDVVSANTFVAFACESRYTLEGNTRLNCATNGWNDDLPTCTKYCSMSQVRGISTKTLCTYRDQKVQCNNRIRPGTIASISCATLFTPPRGHSGSSFRKPLTCTEQGNWDLDRPSCIMNCGLIQPETTAFVKDGIDVNITKVPWHVGIYNIFNRVKYEHMCGGTIISPSIVVSAAHCFWDKANSKIFDKSYFSVAAGKYYRDYYMAKDGINTQKRNINKIIIHSNYNDAQNLYLNDVALLILEKHFEFTDFIRPICIQFRPALSGYVNSNVSGSVAGWGITDDNNPADVLQSVGMKTLSHFDCKPNLPENYNLPEDKFCLSNEFGGTACRGDSGGGFFTKQTIDGGQKWFYSLEGIISHAPERTQDCAKNGIVALTSIQVEEIKSLIEENMLADERKF